MPLSERYLDPRAEIEAARRVLAPGGVLVIEVPDPESRYGLLVKSYWCHWLTNVFALIARRD